MYEPMAGRRGVRGEDQGASEDARVLAEDEPAVGRVEAGFAWP